MRRCVLPLSFGLVVWLAGAASAQESPLYDGPAIARVNRLAVVVIDRGEFTVIDEQVRHGSPGAVGATVTASTLGAVGGFLVGAIAQGMSASEDLARDEEMARRLAPRLGVLTCSGPVRATLDETLRESGRFTAVALFAGEPSGEALAAYDAVLSVRVTHCGIRRVGALESRNLAGFADLRVEMRRIADDRLLWEERSTLLGGDRWSLQTYRQDASLLRRELAETLADAGYRVAMDLLYPAEETE